MSHDTDIQTLAEVLANLQVDRDSMPWRQRVALAGSLSNRLSAVSPMLDTLPLLEFLAADPKPEVRQAVANLLPRLPDEVFDQLRAVLDDDDNSFVRNSVQKAADRRVRTAQTADRVRFGVDLILDQLSVISERFGERAARQTWRLCERYTELLVGSMVHDLRSILTHLKANLAVKSTTGDETEPKRPARNVTRVKDDIEFLERTVGDMEQFTESLTLERQPEKLSDLLQAALEIAVASVRSNGEVRTEEIQVHVDVSERIVLHVARHLIVTALANVIKNAYEAFVCPPQQGSSMQINITATDDGACVELIVRDNGMGFSQEESNALRLLTPGRRNKTKRNSTGYGLPNAMRKIAAHGGTIQFESQEGQGTTVVIRLPINPAGGGS
jgi:K+-sensing histidine kinase KdpD